MGVGKERDIEKGREREREREGKRFEHKEGDNM